MSRKGQVSNPPEKGSGIPLSEKQLLTLLEGLSLKKDSMDQAPQYPQTQALSQEAAGPFNPKGTTLFHQGCNSLQAAEVPHMFTSRTQVSHLESHLPLQGPELLEKLHSLRLLNPDSSEDLSISEILDLEKAFRGYPYPWIFSLQMRDLALAYNPKLQIKGQGNLPDFLESMLPCVKPTQFQGTWDFIMLLLMPVMVGHLLPSGWQQVCHLMNWLLYSQTIPGSTSMRLSGPLSQGMTMSDIIKQRLPEGWTDVLIQAGKALGYPTEDPQELTPIMKENIENILIETAKEIPELMKTLAQHVVAVDNIYSGRLLRWLASDPWIQFDDPKLRKRYLDAYMKISTFGGEIYRTSNGPRFIIPDRLWEDYSNMKPSSQEDFRHVAWMQVAQFNKQVLLAGIEDVYSVLRNHIVDMFWETGGYRNLNDMVVKEFNENNNYILDSQVDPIWAGADNKPDIFLPASGSIMRWDAIKKGWYRQDTLPPWTDISRPDIDGNYRGNWDIAEEVGWESPQSTEYPEWKNGQLPTPPPTRPLTPSLASNYSYSDDESIDEGPLLYQGSSNTSATSLTSLSSCAPEMVESQFLPDGWIIPGIKYDNSPEAQYNTCPPF